MMKSIVVLFAAGLLVAGCSDGGDSGVPAPSAAPAPAAVGVQPAPDASVVAPPVAAPVAPPPQPGQPSAAAAATPAFSGPGLLQDVEKDYVPVLINLNNAYQEFRSSEMRSPRDFNELISSGKIKDVPAAPPGKRFFIDEPNLRVILIKG